MALNNIAHLVIDYTSECEHPGMRAATGRGKSFFAFIRLETPHRNWATDGKKMTYLLQWRNLNKPCQHPKDEAWNDADGCADAYFQAKDPIIRKILRRIRAGKTVNLFNYFGS